MHALGHIHERAARPCRRVQGPEFVVFRGDDRSEVFLHQLRVLTYGCVGIDEDDALLGKIILNGVVDDLGFVLGRNTGNQAALLGFGYAQPVVGGSDILREILPACSLLADGLDIVLEILRVESRKIHTPFRHRLLYERPVTAQTHVEHPLRFVLVRRDLTDHVLIDAFFRRFSCGVGIMPSVAVFAELLDDLVVLSQLVFIDATAIGDVLIHLHIPCGMGRLVICHLRCLLSNSFLS